LNELAYQNMDDNLKVSYIGASYVGGYQHPELDL